MTTCECFDGSCPTGHDSSGCKSTGHHYLVRIDMGGQGVVMCSPCRDDAVACGLFCPIEEWEEEEIEWEEEEEAV